MTLQEILDAANVLLNKDQSGKTFQENMYSSVLRTISTGMYENQLTELKKFSNQTGTPLQRAVEEFQYLVWFRQWEHADGGFMELPDNYGHYLAVLLSDGTNYGDRLVDMGTMEEFHKKRLNVFSRDIHNHPIGYILHDKHSSGSTHWLEIIPYDVDVRIHLQYLRLPDEPYYDYCVDTTTDLVVYMPVGSKIKTDNKLYDSGDALLHPNTVTHIDSPSLPYQSRTVELDWMSRSHEAFVMELVKWAATNIREQLPLMVAQQSQQEDKLA